MGVDFGGKGRLRLDQLVFCCLRFWVFLVGYVAKVVRIVELPVGLISVA